MSNSFDIIYVFSQIFGNKFRFEPKYNEIYLDKSFNIFDYPVGIRKIFYKYHNLLSRSHGGNFKKVYSSDKLEKDILKDDELVCIPMEFISDDEIEKRSFGKLLSQDYDFIHLTNEIERNHYKFNQIVHYDENVLGNTPTYNMNYYIHKGMAGYDMFRNLPRFVEYLDEDLLIDYMNTTPTFNAEDEILLRFYNKGENKMVLYENLNNKAKDKVIELILNKYYNVPNNLYNAGADFPSIIKYYKLHNAKTETINFLSNYFINLIRNDDYRCDFNLVPKSMWQDEDTYIVNNKHGKYSFDITKTKKYQVASVISNMSINKNKLESIELLESIYPKDETINIDIDDSDAHIQCKIDMNVFNEALTKFNIKNPQIYQFAIKYATIPLLLSILGKRTIKDVSVLAMRNQVSKDIRLFDLYSLNVPEIVNYIATHACDKYIMDNFTYHMVKDMNALIGKSYQLFKFFNYYDNDMMDYMLEHDKKITIPKPTDENVVYGNAEMDNADLEDVDEDVDEDIDEKTLIGQIRERITNPFNATPIASDRFTDWVCENYLSEPKLIPEKISMKFVKEFVTKFKNNYEMLYRLFMQQKDLIHPILEISPDFVDYWFCNEICRKAINKMNFEEVFNDFYMNRNLPDNCKHGFKWIETYHEEPPLKIYMNPNHNVDGETNAKVWARCVNSYTIPKEMTSMNYYTYMIKTNGKRRDPDATVMYTFFSNSLENKIIFCRSDVEFTEPAVCRYTIPVDYSEVKPYLHEELETNGICMFCKVTDDDWDKIAGGRKTADIVCFSDCKNIYRERNPLKNVIKYIVNMIQDKFDKEVIAVE